MPDRIRQEIPVRAAGEKERAQEKKKGTLCKMDRCSLGNGKAAAGRGESGREFESNPFAMYSSNGFPQAEGTRADSKDTSE